jgi:mRNA interferase MazF
MTIYKRGDIVLVRFPHSDLKSFTHRPALVVQSEKIETDIPQCIVALITSNLARSGPSRVQIAANSAQGIEMGILTDSVIVLDNLATIRDASIFRRIGTLRDLLAVDTALQLVLGLS